MAQAWQEINAHRRSCHSWRERSERMIAAMTTFLFTLALIALAALLVRYARHDLFAGTATRADDHDDLGPADPRRHVVARLALT
jgi:hypothetical protein